MSDLPTRRAPRTDRTAGMRRLSVRAAALVVGLAAGIASAHAGPKGGRVVAGSGTITRPDAATTVVKQKSRAMAVDWRSFDIAAGERVRFRQPSSSAAVLNRIHNQLPTQIYGSIEANGKVFIINPRGVVFGADAAVNVGALFASSLEIGVDNFMNGRYEFNAGAGSEPGLVVNHGLIRAATGDVALFGGAVANHGKIVAELGNVVLGAARHAAIDFDGDGMIRFQLEGELLGNVAGGAGAVVNAGEITAGGGQVLLGAEVARSVFDHAINNSGVIRAARISRDGGEVRLAALGAEVRNDGLIDVSAPAAGGAVSLTSDVGVTQNGTVRADGGDGGRVLVESDGLTVLGAGSLTSAAGRNGKGGEVLVLGGSVAVLRDATADASGALGGGSILVGGGFQGGDPALRNAARTGVAPGARLVADAGERGDGGTVVVWSDGATAFYGDISARGGAAGGDGGFAEVSGKGSLAYHGDADLRAGAGERGTLLLDPSFIVILGGTGDGAGDGTDTFGVNPGDILFTDLGPTIIYESEIELQSVNSDIHLQASDAIVVGNTDFDHRSDNPGDTASGTLALASGSSLIIETANNGTLPTGLINLSAGTHGADLHIVTSNDLTRGDEGGIIIGSEAGGARSTSIILPTLSSESDIVIDAASGTASTVTVEGIVTGRNVDIDATGAVNVPSGARVIGGGDDTSVDIDAGAVTIADAAPASAAVFNSGTGGVTLSAVDDILLGENALGTQSGTVTLDAGGSILAANPTDASDTSSEIVTTGSTVSLRAGADIGALDAQLELAGAGALIVDLDGSLHVSGSDGAGGPGAALTSLSLALEPGTGDTYVLENFTGQSFAFSADDVNDAFVIEELVSASVMDVAVATRDAGILIGDGTDSGGTRLTGASDVRLDSALGIGERDVDDGGLLSVEVSTDGVLTMVARDSIGAAGSALDIASAASGEIDLQADSETGSVHVRALDGLAVVGTGIGAAGGGDVAGARLTVRADVDSGDDLALRALGDAASPGNDLRIEAGASVTLDATGPAQLTLEAGDNVDLAAGRVSTAGNAGHGIVVTADSEGGSADGVRGAIVQSGDNFLLSSPRVALNAGGGIGGARALALETDSLSLDNTTAGDARIENLGDLLLVDVARNGAAGGLLAVASIDGALSTGDAAVATNGGKLSLEARDTTADGSSIDVARVTVGAGGLASAGGAIEVFAAENVDVDGDVASGGGDVSIVAGRAASELVADGKGQLSVKANIDTGGGTLSLGASEDIVQQAGSIIATARLAIASGGLATLASAGNAIERLAGVADGDVDLVNGVALALDNLDVGDGSLHVHNADTVSVAGLVKAGDKIRIDTDAGDIDGAGGRLEAVRLMLGAAGGIGTGAPIRTAVSGDIQVVSRGVGAAGNISLLQQGTLAASQLSRLATDEASGQTVAVAATGVFTVDADPIVTPDIQSPDRVELAGSRIDLKTDKLSGDDVDVRFRSPVTTRGSDAVRIMLGSGRAIFDANVSPGFKSPLVLDSEVIFASGHVTGSPGSTLRINDVLNLAVDTTIEVDNLFLPMVGKMLAGSGDLTLLPATNGANLVIGGSSGIASAANLAFLGNFGGGRELSIGVPLKPTAASPYAGNVLVEGGIDVGNATLTVGGLGDVDFHNHDSPLVSTRAINVIALGDRTVSANRVSHHGGNITDMDASPGAAAVVKSPTIRLLAQGRVGLDRNAFDVNVVKGRGRVEFVTGASDAFVNTTPGGRRLENIALISPILADFRVFGFFGGPLNIAAAGRTVGLETTGLETTGLAELGFVDEGLFLLPEPFTMPVHPSLLPALLDPDFPADRRPRDPDEDGEWHAFYANALRQYVEGRYAVPADASDAERAVIRARVDREWRALVAYYEWVRARERGMVASAPRRPGG